MSLWYHDFSALGFPTDVRSRQHRLNQPAKEKPIREFLSLVPEPKECLDLFCSDGYYSFVMAEMWPEAKIKGIDSSLGEITLALTARTLLKSSHVTFRLGDVLDQLPLQADLILCAGGLYHLREPQRLLRWMRCKYLLLQTVIDPRAEGVESADRSGVHGSRFSLATLEKMLRDENFAPVRWSLGILPGNPDPRDRDSVCGLLERLT